VPQAHTLTVTTGSRAHRLTPLVAIITTAALFAVALVQGVANDPPARTGVDKSAAPVSGLPPSPAWPDQSKSAAPVSGLPASPAWPDESKVAAAIGSGSARSTAPFGRTGPSLPTRRWEQYEKAISSLTPAERRAAFGTGR
jgi:hypothetical protein